MNVKKSISKKITTKEMFKSFYQKLRIENPKVIANYGRSSDGYAYSCGCSHDCCGHKTRYSYNEITFKRKGNLIHAIVSHSFDFNY